MTSRGSPSNSRRARGFLPRAQVRDTVREKLFFNDRAPRQVPRLVTDENRLAMTLQGAPRNMKKWLTGGGNSHSLHARMGEQAAGSGAPPTFREPMREIPLSCQSRVIMVGGEDAGGMPAVRAPSVVQSFRFSRVFPLRRDDLSLA